jgi:hypothetical protein
MQLFDEAAAIQGNCNGLLFVAIDNRRDLALFAQSG